jgi:hypothetical protein
VLLNHWSSSDYLQLVTEKVTAFEREQRELSVVLFGQVRTTLTALLRIHDTACAQALCAGSEPANAQSSCTMTGMSACSNSFMTSSACVCSDNFCNRPRCPSGSISLYETKTDKTPAPPNLLAVQLEASQGMAQPTSPSVQMHQSCHHWFAGAGTACSARQSCEQAWWGSPDMWAGRSGPQVCTGSGGLHASHGGVHPLLSACGLPGYMHILLSVLSSVLCHCGNCCTCLVCCAMQLYVYYQCPWAA